MLAHLAAERAWYDAAIAHLDSLIADLRTEMVSPARHRPVARWNRRRFSYYTGPRREGTTRRLSRIVTIRDARFADDVSADPYDAAVLLDLDVSGSPARGYCELGADPGQPRRGRCSPIPSTTTATRSTRCASATSRPATTSPRWSPRSYYGGAWSADSQWFFYTVHDAAYRPFQIWRHRLGTPVADDVLVLEEPDERFELTCAASRWATWS